MRFHSSRKVCRKLSCWFISNSKQVWRFAERQNHSKHFCKEIKLWRKVIIGASYTFRITSEQAHSAACVTKCRVLSTIVATLIRKPWYSSFVKKQQSQEISFSFSWSNVVRSSDNLFQYNRETMPSITWETHSVLYTCIPPSIWVITSKDFWEIGIWYLLRT